MIEIKGNLWEINADVKCITTNGFVKTNGHAVMGRGTALQAKNQFPEISLILGRHLRNFGNVPGLLLYSGKYSLWSFPVKHNWFEKADIQLIIESASLMRAQADIFKYESILLPRPGCGNGNLSWNYVKKYLEPFLDNRFQIIDL